MVKNDENRNLHSRNLHSRDDFVRLMMEILKPIKPYYSTGCARLKIGSTSAHYEDESAWMEGFSRPLWGLVPFWAGGGSDSEFEEIYKKGLLSGTDPESTEYWGECRDYDQRLVEMAAIAFGILFAPKQVWDALDVKGQDNLAEWLNEINRNKCCDNNWRFFNILVNIALKKKKRPYNKAILEENLNFIETCYTGGGWYIDGPEGNIDYYIPFAIHFYSLIYAIIMKKEDPQRCAVFIKRAEQFGRDFVYWFAEDGSAVPYGRSLTYRFAQSAFYSACIMADIEPLPLGVMKGIIVRNLQYWMSKPIFDKAGLLTIGYGYPNLHMAENYNAPGSPYWAMKTFAILALPDESGFWQCEAEMLPQLVPQKYLKYGNMLIQRRADGNVISFPGGRKEPHLHAHTEEKYAKFAYSAKYGFSVMRSSYTLQEAAPDSTLSFEVNGHIFVRGKAEDFQVLEDRVISDWSPFEGIKVHTEIIPTDTGHRRRHIIESDYHCTAYDAGFALPLRDAKQCVMEAIQGDGVFQWIKAESNTNLINSKTVIPLLSYEIKKGKNRIESNVIYQ